jgi:glycosyltransferase involved in cell wall biosynthesis
VRALKKAKVLIVGAFPPPEREVFGGVVTSCRALVDSTFSERFELILVDSTQLSNPPPPLWRRVLRAARRLLVFLGQMVRSRPHAVVLFASPGASLVEKGAMAWLARPFAIPALIFPRGAETIDLAAASKAHRFATHWSLKGATHFLCQGAAWQRFATGTVGFPLSRAPVVPNWTATNNLLTIGARRGTLQSDQVVRLLFLGWLEEEKGIFELLQACSELADTHPFRLVVAGRGRAEKRAKKWVEGSALAGRVDFAGWVVGEALEQLLEQSDILVLPSWAEGLPNAMIEAMAARLAVVVTAVGNVPDVVTDGQEAVLVQPRQPTALKGAIRRLLLDADYRGALADRGHEMVKVRFAVEPAVELLAEVIESAINSQARTQDLRSTGGR